MIITSSSEAGVLVRSLREMRGVSRRELSEKSGIPLRTVYAVEGEELNNLSIDRFVHLLSALDARLCVEVPSVNGEADRDVNHMVRQAVRGAAGEDDTWGILP